MNMGRILNFRTIVILIFISLLSYGVYWVVISNIFKNNLLLQLAKNESISYKTINSSGFPTQIQTNINEFEIINSRNDIILIESKAIQLSIHPFDLSKVALKSNLISILVNKDNVVFDIDMNSILSVIFVDQNNLHNLNSAINNIKISGNEVFLANLDQVHIKINENSPQRFDINTKVNSARLETINSQNVSIEIKGALKLDNKVLNGSLNLLIKDLKTNEDIFNLPFNIKDNQVIFLFMNIFDLNEILFFL
jgi:hypothetical protein